MSLHGQLAVHILRNGTGVTLCRRHGTKVVLAQGDNRLQPVYPRSARNLHCCSMPVYFDELAVLSHVCRSG